MKIILYPRQKNLGLVTIKKAIIGSYYSLLSLNLSNMSRIDHLLVPENEVHRLRDIESPHLENSLRQKQHKHLVTLTRKEHSELTSECE